MIEDVEVSREASHEQIEFARFDILDARDGQARRDFVEALRVDGARCVWPSVVVRRDPCAHGVRVVVSGQAIRRGW